MNVDLHIALRVGPDGDPGSPDRVAGAQVETSHHEGEPELRTPMGFAAPD